MLCCDGPCCAASCCDRVIDELSSASLRHGVSHVLFTCHSIAAASLLCCQCSSSNNSSSGYVSLALMHQPRLLYFAANSSCGLCTCIVPDTLQITDCQVQLVPVINMHLSHLASASRRSCIAFYSALTHLQIPTSHRASAVFEEKKKMQLYTIAIMPPSWT